MHNQLNTWFALIQNTCQYYRKYTDQYKNVFYQHDIMSDLTLSLQFHSKYDTIEIPLCMIISRKCQENA